MATDESPLRAKVITCEMAGTLAGLFRRRVEETPRSAAYEQYEHPNWRTYTWADVAERVAR